MQIMTPENFNAVLIDGINAAGYGAGAFLLVVMFVGHYIVETLFLVIIVANFDEDVMEASEENSNMSLYDKMRLFILRMREKQRAARVAALRASAIDPTQLWVWHDLFQCFVFEEVNF